MWFRSLSNLLKFERPRLSAHKRQCGNPRARQSSDRPAVEVLEGRWVPAFLAPVDYATGNVPVDLVSVDFNGDNRLDLATTNYSSNDVSVLLGNGDGTFQAARTFAAGTSPTALRAGDLNGDGRIDLAISNAPNSYPQGGHLSVLLGNGDGTFQAPHVISLSAQFPPGYTGSEPLPQSPTSLALGDLNGDGVLDMAAGGWTQYSTFFGYNEDGYPIYEEHRHNFLNVVLGNSDGSFGPATTNLDATAAFVLGDFNGDGRSELLTGYSDSIANAVADFNHDGKLDVLRSWGSNDVVAMLGNGDGTFRTGDVASTGTTIHSAAVGDVNRDGNLDVVVLHTDIEYAEWDDNGSCAPISSTHSAWVLLGYGNGAFAVPVHFDLGTVPGQSFLTDATLSDFDGDGLVDLAAANHYRNSAVLALNDGSWSFPPPSLRINDVTVLEGNSGATAAVFTVTLSAPYDQEVTVDYSTLTGNVNDIVATSGTLRFARGETSKSITVDVIGDSLDEDTEAFNLVLSKATAGTTIADGWGYGTILDDDVAPPPEVSIGDVTKLEGKKGKKTLFVFTVTLSTACDQPVTMSYRTADGAAKTGDDDYVARSGTLTFLPGETMKTITIEVKGDSKREANETFCLDLFGLSSNALFTKNRGLGTILNDD